MTSSEQRKQAIGKTKALISANELKKQGVISEREYYELIQKIKAKYVLLNNA